LSLTGSAEEIDAELAQALREFAESHVQLQKTVDQAKEQIAEAVKAIEERDKNKTKVKTAAREATTSEDANKPTSISPGLFDTAAPAAATNDRKIDSGVAVCAEQLTQA